MFEKDEKADKNGNLKSIIVSFFVYFWLDGCCSQCTDSFERIAQIECISDMEELPFRFSRYFSKESLIESCSSRGLIYTSSGNCSSCEGSYSNGKYPYSCETHFRNNLARIYTNICSTICQKYDIFLFRYNSREALYCKEERISYSCSRESRVLLADTIGRDIVDDTPESCGVSREWDTQKWFSSEEHESHIFSFFRCQKSMNSILCCSYPIWRYISREHRSRYIENDECM